MELNKKALHKAIEQLPQYEPLDTVWKGIEAELGGEKKKDALKDAIGRLPQYEPLESVWNNIKKDLDAAENEKPLKQAIQKLPVYKPSKDLWKNIDKTLEQADKEEGLKKAIAELPEYAPPDLVWDGINQELDKSQQSEAKIISIRGWRKWAAAAAVGLLMISLSWLTFFNTSSDLIYSQEIRNDTLLEMNWGEDEEAFASILAVCKQRIFVCEQPEFKTLKSELEELNDAKDEVIMAMETYGKDAQLVHQLTQIEHQRSDVLKKMVRFI